MSFHVLYPLLELLFAFLDHFRVWSVLLILDYRENCIWSLSRWFDLKEWEFVWFGCFTCWAVVEIFPDRTFVKISNNWFGITSITSISKVNWNSKFFGFKDSYFFWKFIWNLGLLSIKNLGNLHSNLRNCLRNCLVNSMLNFLTNVFSPFSETFIHAFHTFLGMFRIVFHPIFENSTFLFSPFIFWHFTLHVFEPLFLCLNLFFGTGHFEMFPESIFKTFHPSTFTVTFSFTAAIITASIITWIFFHSFHLHSFLESLFLGSPLLFSHVFPHGFESFFLGFPLFFSHMFLHLLESFGSELISFTATFTGTGGTITRSGSVATLVKMFHKDSFFPSLSFEFFETFLFSFPSFFPRFHEIFLISFPFLFSHFLFLFHKFLFLSFELLFLSFP